MFFLKGLSISSFCIPFEYSFSDACCDFCLEYAPNIFFLNVKGSCQYGQSCKYYHPKKNLPDMNTQRMEGNVFCYIL